MRARSLTLLVLVVFLAGCTQSNNSQSSTGPRHISGSIGKAAYQIDVPSGWNGTLFLWSHGYAAPGSTGSAQDAPSGDAGVWFLRNHFALAGSAYSSTGWALEDAFKDQIALLDYFSQHVGKPKRVIAWGASLGGIITAGLVQLYPTRFAGALSLCGVLSGGVATWNSELDAAYAFKTLIAPQSALQLINITDGAANMQLAGQLFGGAAATPQGQARLALVAALIDLPGWFDPTQPEPAATAYAAQAAAQRAWQSRVDFAFAFQYRTELERRAGGNPSWNAGVLYRSLLAQSPDRVEVAALYAAAGLSLDADLNTLDGGSRIKADPDAAAYLARYISFDGQLSVPMLTMHTTGDGLVIPPNETAYAQLVLAVGHQDMLRQVFVHRAGHCLFTQAETVTALEALLHRIDTGRWNDSALLATALNSSALAQGKTANSFLGFDVPPAFLTFDPGPYPRPFAKGDPIPT